jgi:alkanesulfonate monooxygenase SsuD/methylene tetrahydromethanopterin reductase-like flavin-dependent oxidoreductase (luciferase family)
MQLDIILEPDLTPAAIRELGLLAESYGFRAIWAQNYARARDAFMSLVPLAEASKQIRLGVVVVSSYEMHPLKMANSLLTLNEYGSGRACMVVGAGGEWAGVIGARYGKRVTGARETLEILKRASSDDVLNYDGQVYKAWGFNAGWATDPPPQVYSGASGPKMLKMSAAMADGVMMSDVQIPMMDEPLAILHSALSDHGRADAGFRINNFIAWHVKEDREDSYREARRELIIRGWLERPWLEPFLDANEVEVVMQNKKAFLNAYRDRSGNVEGVPEHIVQTLVDGLSCAGDPGDVDRHVDKLQQFAAAGFTEIALRIHDDPADTIRMLGERVLPAVQ